MSVISRPVPLESAGRLPNTRATATACLLITITVAAAYAGSFRGVLVLDDRGTIQGNSSLHGFWSALRPPANGIPTSGRPVANLSFAVNWAISRNRLWSYHLLNDVIHLGSAFALFGVARRALRGNTAAATAIACLWAAHPLQTAAVTYLSQRVESLMGLFFLLTLFAFIRGAEAANLRRSRFLFGGAVIACALGMATKEVMVTAPLIVLLYDRCFVAGSFREAWRARRMPYLALAATWAIVALLAFGSGTRAGTAGFGSPVPWWAYAVSQVHAVAHYLRLAVWPVGLVGDYGRILGGPPLEMIWDALVVALLATATVLLVLRNSPWGFLGAWFFVILAPSSSVVPISTEILAEHRMYLPLAAVIAAVVCGVMRAGRASIGTTGWKGRWGRRIGIAGASLGVLVLAGASEARNHVYWSELTFWRDTAQKVPGNAGAWNNLGNALADIGAVDRAEAAYRRALAIVPTYSDAQVNLGNLLLRTGRAAEAAVHYAAAAPYRSDADFRHAYATAEYQAGNGDAAAGRREDALRNYAAALALDPNLIDARVNYAGLLADDGRLQEALAQLQEAARVQPEAADVHNDVGSLLAKLGDLKAADREFREALRLKPDYAAARSNLDEVDRMLGSDDH